MTKRMLSLVMVLAMVLSLFAGLTITSHAAGTLVTDASTLAAGDVIVLANADDSAYAGAMGTGKFFTSVAEADAIEITLGGSAGAWTLTTSEGTIGTSAAKALNHTGSGTTTWTISIDSDGLASITSTNTSYGTIRYNSQSPRFLNYASTTGTLVHIYKISGGSSSGGHVHSYGDWYSNNDGTHSRDCDDPDGDCTVPTETADCTYGDPVVVAATCSATGTSTKTCTVCGYQDVTVLPIDANAHTDTDNDGVCDDCGEDMPAQLPEITGDIVFGELNLENGVQYTDPFTSSNGAFTVTFAGGGNDGKYYTTGAGIRVYGGGTMTVAATTGTITKIVLTLASGATVPAAGCTDSGTYDPDTTTWTGSANSVVFTRPSGSGHWRVAALTVTVATDSSVHVHSYGDWYSNNDGTHSRDCDDPDGDCTVPTETANCTYGDAVVVPATCSATGTSTQTCTVCGYQNVTVLPIDANAHVDENNDGVCDLCGEDMPQVETYTLNDELHDGDKVVIYHPNSKKALSTTPSGAKLDGVSVTPSNGTLTVEDAAIAVMTVEMSGSQVKFKLADGTYLTSGATGNGVSFAAAPASGETDYGLWTVEIADSTNNLVYIHSVNAKYNNNAQSLEYYSGFTTYGTKTTDAYKFALYTIVNQSAHQHSWGAWYTNNDGTHSRDCDDPDGDCPDPTETANCEYGDWTIVSQPTATVDGSRERTCTVCGYVDTEVLPALGESTIFELVTDLSQLTDGAKVLLVGVNDTTTYAAGVYSSGNNVKAIEVVPGSNGEIAVPATTEVGVYTLGVDATEGYSFKDTNNKYLYAASTSANQMKAQDDVHYWDVTLTEGVFAISSKSNTDRGIMHFNPNNGTPIFACYGSNSSVTGEVKIYVEQSAAPVVPVTASYSLTTGAKIGINLYFENLPDGATVEVNGTAVTLDTKNCYTIEVAAKDYATEYTVTVNGGATQVNGKDSLTVSVPGYIAAEDEDQSKTESGVGTVADVVKAMSNFCYYSATYFGKTPSGSLYNDVYDAIGDVTYNADTFAAISASNIEVPTTATAKDSTDDTVITFYGASLVLESETTLRFYFKTGNTEANDLAATAVTVTGGECAKTGKQGAYVYVDVKVAAKDLANGISVSVDYNGETAEITNYAATSYIKQVLGKTNANENLVNTLKALYVYYLTAFAYFG